MKRTTAQSTLAKLECPFCGNRRLAIDELDGAIWVVCADCHSVGPIAYSQQDAIERWRWLYADAPAYFHVHRSRS